MSKTGRNNKCPCGSGEKYKKCCLNKDQIQSTNIQKKEYTTDERTVISVMKTIANSRKIADEERNGFYRIFRDDTIEKVNPIDIILSFCILGVESSFINNFFNCRRICNISLEY
jgi:hypothetical protein